MGVEGRRAAGGAKKKASPPILSHEFVIQNHGDIMSCILMVVVVGFMFPITTPLSSVFVVPQYNETVSVNTEAGPFNLTVYRNGVRDIFTVLFYTVAWVTMHAIIQEYVLDKVQRKVQVHLSKTKIYKFTESGHQLAFSIYSVIHAGYILAEFIQTHADLKRVWLGYPDEQKFMSLNMKLFAILQLAYWVHQFPEFYFQKMKKDEMKHRTFVSALYIGFIGAAYTMNFMRLATVLLFLQYVAETVFHFARLAHFLDKKTVSKQTFKLWNLIFVVVRLATAVLAVITFWYGLRQNESPYIDIAAGNFNTSYVRLNCMLLVLGLQLTMLWQFLNFHVARFRDNKQRKQKPEQKKKSQTQQGKRQKKNTESENELPEADQDHSSHSTKSQKKQKAQ